MKIKTAYYNKRKTSNPTEWMRYIEDQLRKSRGLEKLSVKNNIT